MDDQLIDVRPDERFDTVKLQKWLIGRLEGADQPLSVRQFSRGRANLTYLLVFGDREYVLRRPPLGPVAEGSHDMAREHRVLSTLWTVFPKAARSFVYCPDPEVIGADFFVMERKHGVVVQGAVPAIYGSGRDEASNRALSTAVIDTLVELHAVDPAEAGLGDLGRPEGFLERQVDGWIGRWDRAKHEDNSLADELGAWLRENLPSRSNPALIHNDWRLDNMALSEQDPGECVAVFDWDMCTRGDPLADLGTLMAFWYDEDEVAAAFKPMPTEVPGFMSRRQAIDRYGRLSGRDLSTIDWYVVFGTYKLAAVLQQIFIRWHRGQTADPRFSVLGDGAAHLMELANSRRP